jgi:16S rRNA (cytosine1402-N4)-methyltransferase
VPDIVRPGGIFAVISFHSLEDRLVKERFKYLAANCVCPPEVLTCARCNRPPGLLLHKKPIIAMEEEVRENPRARSAKLRIFVRNSEAILKEPSYGKRG